jgi:hypothetical protein
MAVKTRKQYTSKKIHSSVKKSVLRAIKQDRTYLEKLQFIVKSWKKLQNPWITIENPNKSQTNRRHIRVRTNDLWGNPKPKKEEMNEG